MSLAAQTIEQMPIGRAHHKMFWLLGSGMLVDAYDIFMQAGVLAAMVAVGFTTTSGIASFIFSTFLGLATGSILSGVLADRFGRRSVYQFNLLIFGISAIIISMVPSFALVLVLRFVMGIGLGGELVVGYALMSEMTPATSRGRWGVALGLLVNTAQPIAAFIGLWVLPLIGWRWMFVIGGVPALVIWYLRRALPESPRWLERRGRDQEAQKILGDLWRENTGGQQLPTIRAEWEPVTQAPRWTVLFSNRLLGQTLFCFLITALVLAAQYAFLAWVPTLLLKSGVSIVHSLAYTAVMAIGAPVGMIIPVLIIDVLGRKATVAGSALLAAIVGVLYAFSLHAAPALLMVIGLMEVLLLQVCANSIIATYLPELFPTAIRGTGAGASIAAGRIGAAAMPYLVLFVLNTLNARAVFLMVALTLLVLSAVVALFGRETKKRTLEEIERDRLLQGSPLLESAPVQ